MALQIRVHEGDKVIIGDVCIVATSVVSNHVATLVVTAPGQEIRIIRADQQDKEADHGSR